MECMRLLTIVLTIYSYKQFATNNYVQIWSNMYQFAKICTNSQKHVYLPNMVKYVQFVTNTYIYLLNMVKYVPIRKEHIHILTKYGQVCTNLQ